MVRVFGFCCSRADRRAIELVRVACSRIMEMSWNRT